MSNEMNRSRRQYTREFKEEAVRLSERGDRTVRQVAKDLGLSEKILHRWRSEMRASRQRGVRFAPGHGQARDEELERLRRENQQRARDFKKGHGLLDAAARVKYEFVEMNRKVFPVAAICRVLGVSQSGYYAWRGQRQMSARARSNEALGVEIRAIHRQYKQRYGIRKMRYELIVGE